MGLHLVIGFFPPIQLKKQTITSSKKNAVFPVYTRLRFMLGCMLEGILCLWATWLTMQIFLLFLLHSLSDLLPWFDFGTSRQYFPHYTVFKILFKTPYNITPWDVLISRITQFIHKELNLRSCQFLEKIELHGLKWKQFKMSFKPCTTLVKHIYNDLEL